jgi:hypothetical protein
MSNARAERRRQERSGEAVRTYWNGEPTPCRIVQVVVGQSPVSTWWCAKLEGTVREAVEVDYHGRKFYLDNERGAGWGKVTAGLGSPQFGHSEIPVARVLTPED